MQLTRNTTQAIKMLIAAEGISLSCNQIQERLGQANPHERLLRIDEVAARLDCSNRTVWAMIQYGKLPKVLLGARSARVPESAVIAFINGGHPNEH